MSEIASTANPIGIAPPIVLKAKAPLELLPLPYGGMLGATLPRREFLCGPAFQRKHMTLTVAPAGVGKTSLTIAEAVHMAAGRELFAPIAGPTRVWLFNGEETRDELERRVVGTIEAHGLDKGLVAANLFFNSGRAEPIILAETGSSGMHVYTDRADHLVSLIRDHGIEALIVDPFVSTHAVQENNNAAIDKVGKLWATIAEKANCAVHLVHHARKMGGKEITAESVRGASSLVAAARYVRALSKVPLTEAKKLGWQGPGELVRLDAAKENNSSTSTKQYFALISHDLGNGDGTVASDKVGVVIAFTPMAGKTVEITAALKSALAAALQAHDHLREDHRAKHWAGKVLGPVLGIDPARDAKGLQDMLKQLVEERLLARTVWTGPNGRDANVLIAGERLAEPTPAVTARAA